MWGVEAVAVPPCHADHTRAALPAVEPQKIRANRPGGRRTTGSARRSQSAAVMRHHLCALLIAGSVAGCALPGERAGSANCWSGDCEPTCPAGETCSPDTPSGLHFSGAPLFDRFDGGPRTTAAGGVQRIGVLRSSTLGDYFESSFDAVTTDAFEVAELSPPEVDVLATSEGSGYLRILEPGTDNLYDRVELHAAAVEVIEMTPAGKAWVDSGVPVDGWSLLAGTEVQIGVRLRGSDPGDALVDESMTVDVKSGAAPGADSQVWDVVNVIPDASGEVTLQATLGDGTAHVQIFPISEKVDEIVRAMSYLDPGETPVVSPKAQAVFCFRAMDGDLAVAGLAWTFSTDADVEVEPLDSCAIVTPTALGPHTLTVQAGGQELLFDFEVVQSASSGKAKKIPALPSAGRGLAAAGERGGVAPGRDLPVTGARRSPEHRFPSAEAARSAWRLLR